jgi:broad specificity phosphatase PhoE
MINKILLFVFGLFILGACSPAPSEKTIYIVRHGEKMLVEDPDPELSQVGTLRATKLSQILADKDIKHVFSTDYKRTRHTAGPSADQAGVEIQVYDPKDQEAFADKLRKLEGNILVVGHSNTVPALVNFFVGSGEKYPNLTDDEYQFIYVVTLDKSGERVNQTTYKDY